MRFSAVGIAVFQALALFTRPRQAEQSQMLHLLLKRQHPLGKCPGRTQAETVLSSAWSASVDPKLSRLDGGIDG